MTRDHRELSVAKQRRTFGSFGMAVRSLVVLFFAVSASVPAPETESVTPRPITVADAITMRMPGDRDYHNYGQTEIAQFAPDGRKFVVVLRRGNLQNNTNEYQLFLWRTDTVFESPNPTLLLSRESSSNGEAISAVQWLPDSKRLAFLGEEPGGLQQVYLFNTRNRRLKRLTHHATNVSSFTVSADGNAVAFSAEEPERNILDEKEKRFGYVVTTEALQGLILNKVGGKLWGYAQLFVQERGQEERQLECNLGIVPSGRATTPYLSPDGNLVAVMTYVPVKELSPEWKEYTNDFFRRTLAMRRTSEISYVHRFALIDTHTSDARVLLDSPVPINDAQVLWRPDSRAIDIGGVYLPLRGTNGAEREQRRSSTFAVEITVPEQNVSIIGKELRLQHFDQKGCVVTTSRSTPKAAEERVFCPVGNSQWQPSPAMESAVRPVIELAEGMNSPPMLYATDRAGHRTVLMDLNPQFSQLRFAREEILEWRCKDGHIARGGLYYPIDYKSGWRYPLVIQTHSFEPDRFWMLGPWTTGYAAQPLAAKNIMVLQVDEGHTDKDTPVEVDREIATIEGAIEYLDTKQFIDVNRVGLFGFSRSCLYVRYALVRSKYHFAAASIADGVDGSYFQYLQWINHNPAMTRFFEGVNDGVPFGSGIQSWIKRSVFDIDKIDTPLRVLAISNVLAEWELFGALNRLAKPVEMIYLNDGDHILQKPWQRFVSEQGNVDWFCFWLKGEEDPDPTKTDQYARWRELRKMQEENQKKVQVQ